MARRRLSLGNLEALSAPISRVLGGGDPVISSASAAGQQDYEGALTGLQDNAITGWIWDKTRPYTPIDVQLYVGDALVGQGSADRFDLELAKAQRGNGMHRFELRLDRLPGNHPPFTVRAVVAGSEMELQPALTINRLEEAERLVAGSEYAGQITGIEEGGIVGWVYNKRNPHERPSITLREGGREVLNRIAGEQISVTDSGKTVNAFRFQLPFSVPTTARLHVFSVCVGQAQREIEGSPILFGASDSASIGRSLASLFERIDGFEKRLDAIRPSWDFGKFETEILKKMTNPVDMLLGVHRDAIEAEMAVLRRQLTRLVEHSSIDEKDLLPPQSRKSAVDDVKRSPASAFEILARAAPTAKFDFSANKASARPSGGLSWARLGKPRIILNGAGTVELEGAPLNKVSVVLVGTGATDFQEFRALSVSFNGKPLGGRFEIGDEGHWSFVGTMIGEADTPPGAKGLSVAYLTGVAKPSGALGLTEIAIFPPGRAPTHLSDHAPRATILTPGPEMGGSGWYPVEDSGICWMGAQAEVSLKLRQSENCYISIPAVRALTPALASKVQIYVDGQAAVTEAIPVAGDESVFNISGRCAMPETGSELRALRIAFPEGAAKSPNELGINKDERQLTLAVRSIALQAE